MGWNKWPMLRTTWRIRNVDRLNSWINIDYYRKLKFRFWFTLCTFWSNGREFRLNRDSRNLYNSKRNKLQRYPYSKLYFWSFRVYNSMPCHIYPWPCWERIFCLHLQFRSRDKLHWDIARLYKDSCMWIHSQQHYDCRLERGRRKNRNFERWRSEWRWMSSMPVLRNFWLRWENCNSWGWICLLKWNWNWRREY